MRINAFLTRTCSREETVEGATFGSPQGGHVGGSAGSSGGVSGAMGRLQSFLGVNIACLRAPQRQSDVHSYLIEIPCDATPRNVEAIAYRRDEARQGLLLSRRVAAGVRAVGESGQLPSGHSRRPRSALGHRGILAVIT